MCGGYPVCTLEVAVPLLGTLQCSSIQYLRARQESVRLGKTCGLERREQCVSELEQLLDVV